MLTRQQLWTASQIVTFEQRRLVCKLKEKWYRVASWEMEDPGTKRQDLADSTTLIDKIQTL